MAINSVARLGRATLLTLAAGALAMATTGCSLLGEPERPGGGDRPTGAAGVSGSDAPAAEDLAAQDALDADNQDAGGSNAGGGNGGNGSNSGNGSGGNGNGSGGKGSGGKGNGNGSSGGHTETGPTIVYFRVAQRPTCPQGTNLNPIPGKPLVIEWKVRGAHQVELAVDGPGLYKTYGTSGTETFTFGCGGSPGRVETHTYKLTTVGGGAVRSKTISAKATVKEISDVGPPPAPPAP
jgi:hypothetical protein